MIDYSKIDWSGLVLPHGFEFRRGRDIYIIYHGVFVAELRSTGWQVSALDEYYTRNVLGAIRAIKRYAREQMAIAHMPDWSQCAVPRGLSIEVDGNRRVTISNEALGAIAEKELGRRWRLFGGTVDKTDRAVRAVKTFIRFEKKWRREHAE